MLNILRVVTAALFVIAVAVGVLAYFTHEDAANSYMPVAAAPGSTAGSQAIPNGATLPIQPNETPTPERVAAEMQNVAIPGWRVITIAANTTDVVVDFFNPEDNAGAFYLTFAITLAGENETLWSSGLVEPGSHVRNITLSHPVEAGEYTGCTLHVQPYFMSDKTPANNANMEFTLVAQ